MGEMTIRLDDALLVELRELASRRGVDLDALASELLRAGLRRVDRAASARRILSMQRSNDMSSTDIIREWRDT